MNPKKLHGKWALVTGSSRGIGQQVAIGLAEEGCNIILHGRTLEHCAGTLGLLKEYGVDVRAVAGELGTPTGDQSVIDAVLAEQVPVDILYNNAAVGSDWKDSAFDIPLENWEWVFNINLFAVIRLCNAFTPLMVTRGWGRIVNVSSGIKDQPQLAPYSVSKAAVDKYTQDLATELKGTGVIINTLDPGWLKTDLGGEQADHEVETVLPGALVPVLLDDQAESGRMYAAQDFRRLEK
ncbi:SDR family NAD(P)-dependent oxidoreductase [Pontiella sulfatireligans]|uniref:3-oxoacyl-[acyl-carrier-protein] reductase FabG n=1 Tax=Pontiella sulfatireligans TaxID=2750658 RepID=A0A6C2UE85_9BACT|nr:SDR family oxidoreductase [Pontiella sulfatireligans]VGO18219.1 3-oxoacyl-[acyl-carrier-protein] reductase FabG [Pontiella sulfatireligans]